MLNAGFVSKCVSDYVGRENLRKFKVRFATRVWPGDTITCQGSVTKKYEEGGKRFIEGDLVALNQKGETAIAGSFKAELPGRG
jgi:acyl dehydratase